MKKLQIRWLLMILFTILYYSCGFLKTLTKSEYAAATGKESTDLSMLAVPPCILSESFSMDKTDYSVSLPANIYSIAIVAATEIDEASIKINGKSAKKNSFSNKVNVTSLNNGESLIITVEVKNDYTLETKKYRITAVKTTGSLAFSEDFETGNFSKYGLIKNGKKVNVQSYDKYQGQYAVRFGEITYEKNFYFSTFVSNTSIATVSFYYKKPDTDHTDPSSIYFRIIIDNNLYTNLNSDTWQPYSFILQPGEHILTWNMATSYVYSKDDFGFIDNILIH